MYNVRMKMNCNNVKGNPRKYNAFKRVETAMNLFWVIPPFRNPSPTPPQKNTDFFPGGKDVEYKIWQMGSPGGEKKKRRKNSQEILNAVAPSDVQATRKTHRA